MAIKKETALNGFLECAELLSYYLPFGMNATIENLFLFLCNRMMDFAQ